MDDISIVVSGNRYSNIKEAQVSRTIEGVAGSFEVIIANRSIKKLNIKVDDDIKVYVGDKLYITGYIERMNSRYGLKNHDLSISGKDNTIDLIEGDVSENIAYTTTSFSRLCELVLFTHNIPVGVVDLSGSNGKDLDGSEISAGEASETLFDFMNRYAIKTNNMLTTDGKGNLVVYKNSGVETGVTITNGVGEKNPHIKSANFIQDNSKRYRKIIIKSQLDDLDDGGEDISGEAEDKNVQRQRTKVIISEAISDADIAKKIAEWEVNTRRSASRTYSCVLHGFRTGGTTGAIWEPNMKVSVNDEFAGINAKMMVKTVSFTYSENTGSLTSLELVSEDSFSLQTQAKKLAEGLQ